MKIQVWADHEHDAFDNAERLKPILALGHTVELNNFIYCAELGKLIFEYHILNFKLIGLHEGQRVIDKKGNERVLSHKNTGHVYSTMDGGQLILGDFEIKSAVNIIDSPFWPT